jgi:peptidoglycan/xylan/chitin deacetylase (PgdA/CDA1 family)
MNLVQSEAAPATYRLYDFAFRAIRAARIDRAFEWVGGARGVIFALHRVRPYQESPFQPNLGLEITPDFLEAAIAHTQSRGFTFVSMDEALQRLNTKNSGNFAVMTLDDGYYDTVEYALPVFEKHNVPATVYIATGFADRLSPLWWLTLEETIKHSPSIFFLNQDGPIGFATDTMCKKREVFRYLHDRILELPPDRVTSVMAELAKQADIDVVELCRTTCLDWDGIKALSRHPLLTIGAHTVSHPVLARCNAPEAMVEMARSRAAIEDRIDKPVRHFAYPNGEQSHAGPREFSMANALGFASATTTRPGLIYQAHDQWPTALPRVSLNGFFQSIEKLDTMLSGAPFVLRNLGSRLNIS